MYDLLNTIGRAINKIIIASIKKVSVGFHGHNVDFGRNIKFYGISTVHLGSDVFLGEKNILMYNSSV